MLQYDTIRLYAEEQLKASIPDSAWTQDRRNAWKMMMHGHAYGFGMKPITLRRLPK